MRDRRGREIDYLRLSVTDRCNLRCIYCMPREGVPRIPNPDLLDFDETLRAVRLVAAAAGIRKLRVTGGEPLVRRDITLLVRMLSELGFDELTLTTNGLLLEDFARPLAEAGVDRVNLSMDSLRNDRLRRMTGREVTLERLERGLDAAIEAGLGPVSLNCVVLRGLNDDEVPDLITWAASRGNVRLRFIEHMPVTLGSGAFVSMDEIVERAGALGRVDLVERPGKGTVEALYKAGSDENVFGVVAPLSGGMCSRCDRIRLAATGLLVTCLAATPCLDLRHLLRAEPAPDEGNVVDAIKAAIEDKPKAHGGCIRTAMWMIGG